MRWSDLSNWYKNAGSASGKIAPSASNRICSNLEIFHKYKDKYTNTQIYKYTNTKTNTQIHKHTNTQIQRQIHLKIAPSASNQIGLNLEIFHKYI